MKMGSAGNRQYSDETEEDINHSGCSSEVILGRPEFFPCGACGRLFTTLALKAHKSTCTEKSDCSCAVCKVLPLKQSEHENVTGEHMVFSDGHNIDSESVKHHHNGNLICIFAKISDQTKNLTFQGSTHEKNKIVETSIHCLRPAGIKHSDHSYSNVDFSSVSESSGDCKNVLSSNDVTHSGLVRGSVTRSYKSTKSARKSNDGKNVAPVVEEIKVEHAGDVQQSPDCDPPNHSLLCNVCNKEIYYDSFGSHIIQHCQVLMDKYLLCPKCPQKFSKPGKLLIHFHKHMAEFVFACMYCKESFPSCSKLRHHAQEFHSNFAFYPFHCYICLRRFAHSQTIINHMRLHSKETPFKCEVCPRSFNQVGNLHRHLSVHRGERPHKCSDCGKAFADPATLRNHVRTHTGETPYVCKICKRAFTQIGNLKRHIARHLQGRSRTTAPYSYGAKVVLSDSNSSFKENNSMALNNVSNEPEVILKVEDGVSQSVKKSRKNEEVVNVQEEAKRLCDEKKWELYPCPVCARVYTWQHDLNIHFRVHSGERPYSCDICHKTFAQSGAVRTHKLRHHWDVIPPAKS